MLPMRVFARNFTRNFARVEIQFCLFDTKIVMQFFERMAQFFPETFETSTCIGRGDHITLLPGTLEHSINLKVDRKGAKI
jgi:hypothetical protein